MEFPKELGLPIEEEGVIPRDETIMHSENTKGARRLAHYSFRVFF